MLGGTSRETDQKKKREKSSATWEDWESNDPGEPFVADSLLLRSQLSNGGLEPRAQLSMQAVLHGID
jgi:hypothetical protein